MSKKSLIGLVAVAGLCASMGAMSLQIGAPMNPRNPSPLPTYEARTYYAITLRPGTAANGWQSLLAHSSTMMVTTEPDCAGAFAAQLEYIANHGYIYQGYRTCN